MIRRVLLALTGFVVSVGCAGGTPAVAVRPSLPTARDAQDERCEAGTPTPEPLVVDMPAEQRGDVEIAMKEGVAVVRYDCKALKLLRDCKIAGSYGFKGMQTKERVVRLDNADDIRANLPTLGGAMPIGLKSGLERGSTLDVALVMIGKRRTTWLQASSNDLRGSCEGATHFVRGATIGAFAMRQGSHAQVSTVAQIFAASAGADSSSRESIENKDGSLDACKKAGPDDERPPAQCGSPVRLELTAIKPPETEHVTKPPEEPLAEAVIPRCGSGLVRSPDGLCVKPEKEAPHACAPSDAVDCERQCTLGDAASCNNMGVLLVSGQGVSKDEARAAQLFEKACADGEGNGCINLAKAQFAGRGVAKDPARAGSTMKRACDLAFAPGCTKLGLFFTFGFGVPQDAGRAAQLFAQGCDGGDKLGCTLLGERYARGRGVVEDQAKAVELYRRACDGRDPDGCNDLADAYEQGKGVEKSLKDAVPLYTKACELGGASGCAGLAALWEMGASGDGIAFAPDDAKARSLYERAYALAPIESIAAILNVVFGQKRPIDAARVKTLLPTLDQECGAGSAGHCANAGLLRMATGARDAGARDLHRACELLDKWSCFEIKRLSL